MRITFVCVTLLVSAWFLGAQDKKLSIFESLQFQDLLDITLETDFQPMISDPSNEAYQAATFSYEDANGKKVVWNAQIKQRGKFRRRICEMPPLKLKFAKADLEANKLNRDYNEMKVVTYCVDDPSAKETVVKEYLIYKLYNELSEQSFRVQLVRINYVDTADPTKKIKQFGFLIEDIEELAGRFKGVELEAMNIDSSRLNPRQETVVYAFEYLIGNSDWSTMMLRNVKLIQPFDSTQKVIIVPYDFDFSGLVDAPYAVPDNSLGLKSVKDRAFLGYYDDPAYVSPVKRYIESKKDEMYAIINDCKYLTKPSKATMIAYLDTFFNPTATNTVLHAAFK